MKGKLGLKSGISKLDRLSSPVRDFVVTNDRWNSGARTFGDFYDYPDFMHLGKLY